MFRRDERRTSLCPTAAIAISPSQVLKGSFVACRGVCVVAVNWKRQSPLEPLIQTRSRAALADVAASYRDRALVTTGGTDPAIRPYHTFQQTTAMLPVPKRGDHVINSPNIGKCCQHHFRHTYLQQDLPKKRMQVPILQEICCLSLIRARTVLHCSCSDSQFRTPFEGTLLRCRLRRAAARRRSWPHSTHQTSRGCRWEVPPCDPVGKYGHHPQHPV